MRKELVSFDHLKDYASFLYNNHLDAIVKEDLKRSKILKVPLLKLFKHMSEEELFEFSRKEVGEYLLQIIEGRALESVMQSMEAWKADKLPGVPREKVNASDIALIYNVRKHSLLGFLPQYTTEVGKAVALMREIEDYYTFQESLAIKTFAEISQDEIRKSENRLRQAQSLAQLGYWEYDLEKGSVVWSEELFRIYGLDPAKGIDSATIAKHILAEDITPLMNKVNEIYRNGGSFTQEYRIRNTGGEVKVLYDKGYVEVMGDGKVIVKGISQDITERRRIEEKAHEHEYFIQQVADVSPFVMSVYDMELNKVVYVNRDVLQLIGYSEEEVKKLGLDIRNVAVHPEDRDKAVDRMSAIKNLQDDEVDELEYRVRDKDGGWKWIYSRASVFRRNERGEVTQFLTMAIDATRRKQAEENLKYNEALLKEAQQMGHMGSWEWDTVTNEVIWSDEMYRIFGYAPGESPIDYEQYLNHIHPEDRELVKTKVMNCFLHQVSYTFEHRMIRNDGSVRWLFSKGRVSRKEGDKVLRLAGIAMDITEDKKAEEALKQRTAALEASNKELEAFCYTISHDLRSPLRAIDGFGRRLANQYSLALDREGQRLLNVVRTNAQQMGLLIDSLLEFSRLNRREVKKATLKMQDEVLRVLEGLREQYPEYCPKVNLHPLHDSSGDRDLLRQVWHNLISNAFKFSSRTAGPVVEIGSRTEGSRVIYYVKDNGAGFDMEYKDKLFGVFQRLHSADEFGGTGVGLATVQRIVHRHGGTVWAEGKPGAGAIFYFALPLEQEVMEKAVYLQQKL